MKDSTSVAAIIPAYNASATLEELLERTEPFVDEIVVINDGSTDGTGKLLQRLSRRSSRLKVIDQPNSGKTAAIRNGIQISSSDLVVLMDSDLQHIPEEIPRIIRPIQEGTAEVVVGERNIRSERMPPTRKISNGLIDHLFYMVTGKRFRDVQCGFRALRKDRSYLLGDLSEGYLFDVSFLINVCQTNLRMERVSVSCAYPDDNLSSFQLAKETPRYFRFFFSQSINRLRRMLNEG